MRIKFEKGFIPERVAEGFVNYIRDNNLVIGSVNMYIQTYGDDMKTVKFNGDDEYLVCSPTDITKEEYEKDVVRIRRGKIKLIQQNNEGLAEAQ